MSSSVQEQPIAHESEPPRVSFACAGCGKKLRARVASAGKTLTCPQCHHQVVVPALEPQAPPRASTLMMIVAAVLMIAFIFGCAIYANLSFAVTDPANLRYFPPYKPSVNANMNQHLGAEYYNIAKAIVAGDGFANPWGVQSGPTAWMPPVLPAILAALLWICDGDRDIVMAIVIFLQVYVLIGTGILVLLLARQTTQRLWALAAAAVFIIILTSDFRLWFQMTHDTWLVLLALDLVVAGFAWFEPLRSWKTAAGWGVLGGFSALVNPIVALIWGLLTIAVAVREWTWRRLAVAVALAGLTVAPWTIRNYLVFGRLIPVKSNAAYELYQSQCLQKDGLLRDFAGHPYGSPGRERQEYKVLGEMAFLDKKREIFWKAVWDDPDDLIERAVYRFVGATVWYVPFNRADETRRPVVTWLSRLLHPLPLLGLLAVAVSALWRRVHWAQWLVMGVYLLYLGPYILVSYYERYAMPLVGVKILLVIWGLDAALMLAAHVFARVWQRITRR